MYYVIIVNFMKNIILSTRPFPFDVTTHIISNMIIIISVNKNNENSLLQDKLFYIIKYAKNILDLKGDGLL